jgi:hypothetical protein
MLRKYNPYIHFEEGKFIDAQDTINSWCLAQIIATDNRNVNVHFDGWSNRWDVVSNLYYSFRHLINISFTLVAENHFLQDCAFQKVLKRVHWSEQGRS